MFTFIRISTIIDSTEDVKSPNEQARMIIQLYNVILALHFSKISLVNIVYSSALNQQLFRLFRPGFYSRRGTSDLLALDPTIQRTWSNCPR